MAVSPGHPLRGGLWVRTRAEQGEKQKQRVGMLLAWVRAGKVPFLSDMPSPCGWGQPFGLGAYAALSPQGSGLQCPLSLLCQQPPPLHRPEKSWVAPAGLDWLPAPCPGPAVEVEQRLGGPALGCCLLSFAPLARGGEEKRIINPKRPGNFFLEHEGAGREALVPGMSGWSVC